MLTSWKPQHLRPVLTIYPYMRSTFTRKGFVDVLHRFGTISGAWLQTIEQLSPTCRTQNDYYVKYKLCVRIRDLDAERELWSGRLKRCFPTWERLGQLHCIYIVCTYKAITYYHP